MVAVPCDYLRLEISQIQMSLLSDSPYFVEAPFHSDGWREMLTRKTAVKKVHAGQNSLKGMTKREIDSLSGVETAQQAHQSKLDRREKDCNYFRILQQHKDKWTGDFRHATKQMYEVLYLKDNILYQGHSIAYDIYRHENNIYNPHDVECDMHERGESSSRTIQMDVPRRLPSDAKDAVLWRKCLPKFIKP